MAAPNASAASDRSLSYLAWALRRFHHNSHFVPNVVYMSTTGVYGNLNGGWADERTPLNPESARAKRRVQTEKQLRQAYQLGQVNAQIVRAPGIYSANRLPVERLKKNLPALKPSEDSYSNHIHELDLAKICFLAQFKARPWDVINAVDEAPLKMGEYFDLVAKHLNLPPPQRMSKENAKKAVSPMMWSFMQESRRIRSRRLKALGVRLRFPTIDNLLKI